MFGCTYLGHNNSVVLTKQVITVNQAHQILHAPRTNKIFICPDIYVKYLLHMYKFYDVFFFFFTVVVLNVP